MAKKNQDNEVVLSVDHVSKNFHLPHEKSNSIKSKIVNVLKPKNKEVDVQHALKDISFEVKKGEFFGILGRNGSGKSTLLKILAEIYQPTTGSVGHEGKLVPFIELGVGFNPELTGRENVYLNGALLGFSRKEIDAKYKSIVEFAELEDFMDQKLKNYSSGMQVRLAFSVAIQAEGDILVLDEVLAVGDTNFQQKCNDYFERIRYESKTVILVTHNMDAVIKYCTRAMIINDGYVLDVGEPERIAQKYDELNASGRTGQLEASEEETLTNADVTIKMKVNGHSGAHVINALDTDRVTLYVGFSSKTVLPDLSFGLTVFNGSGIPVFATNTKLLRDDFMLSEREARVFEFELDNIFSNGVYDIALALRSGDGVIASTRKKNAFSVYGRKHDFAITSPSFDMHER